MPLGAEHVQATLLEHTVAQLDVDAAAGHVGRDRDRPQLPGVLDDGGLALVVLGVQHLVLDAAALEQPRQMLGHFDRDRADQHRLAGAVPLDDVVDRGRKLLFLGLVDLVVLVEPHHRPVGRHRHHLEAVDLVELVGLGQRRAGHARELLVHAEVVLDRDRGDGDVLVLDLQALFGLDRLVQSLRPAPAFHLAAGELVDDVHLAVLDHVLDIAVVELLGLDRLDQVVHELAVLGGVQVVDPQRLLDLGHALLGGRGGVHLLVDLVVVLGLELADRASERVVGLGRGLGLTRDDQRRARLVDQDRVDLVDDRKPVPVLHGPLHGRRHVVAQVVEAELGVGAVGDVGVVGGPPLVLGHHRLDHADR